MFNDNSLVIFIILVFFLVPLFGIGFYFYTLWKYKKDKKKYQSNIKIATVILILSIIFLIVTMPRPLLAIKLIIDGIQYIF